MKRTLTPENAGAMLQAQGVQASPQGTAEAAKFAEQVLGHSAGAFATLAFEDEPSGYIAAKLRHAP